MITENNILDFNNEIQASRKQLEEEIAEVEQKMKDLHRKMEILVRTHKAIQEIVGKDDRPIEAPMVRN